MLAQVRVRFQRQDSSHSITSRASSRGARRDLQAEKQRGSAGRHVTDDVTSKPLPYPLEVSGGEVKDDDKQSEETTTTTYVDLQDSADQQNNEELLLVQQAKNGWSNIEKVIEQLRANNEALRRERNTALNRMNQLSQRCATQTTCVVQSLEILCLSPKLRYWI